MNGSGTDASYDRIGQGYARFRKPDPRIEARLMSALADARTVVNVGAGTGSYEPTDRVVLAVEPSEQMIKQRPPTQRRASGQPLSAYRFPTRASTRPWAS